MNNDNVVIKISKCFRQYAKDIENMDDEEVGQLFLLLYKLRADLESGRYDTTIKRWSDIQWKA